MEGRGGGARSGEICNGAVKTPFFRERRRRFLLNKIKYQVIVPERRKAAIRRSLSTGFSKPAFPFLYFILPFKPRLFGRKFLSRNGGDVFQRSGPCARVRNLCSCNEFLSSRHRREWIVEIRFCVREWR